MKKAIIILFLIPIVSFGQIQTDKVYHSMAGAGIVGVSFIADKYVFERELTPFAPTLIAMCFASGKEFYDSFQEDKRYSGRDWAATVGTALIVNIGVNIYKKVKKRNKRIEIDPFDLDNLPLVEIKK